jgi:hypothetical protein
MARSEGLAHLVRQAFADSLDVTFAIAAGIGVVAAMLVFTLVRPAGARPAGVGEAAGAVRPAENSGADSVIRQANSR